MGRHSKPSAGRTRKLTASVVVSTTCAGTVLALADPSYASPEQSRISDLRDRVAGDPPAPTPGAPAPAEPVAEHLEIEVPVPAAAAPPPGPAASGGQRIVDAAASQAGTPYAYGGTGQQGFDCSGFTQYSHRQAGIPLPRTSSEQAAAVTPVAKSAAQPGDLLFFHGNGGGVYHAAIYAGDGQMWTAPQSGDVVKLQPVYSQNYTVGRAW